MMKISVHFAFILVMSIFGTKSKNLVQGIKRQAQQNEDSEHDPLFENSGYPAGYSAGNRNPYLQLRSLLESTNFRANMMKRSLNELNPKIRQTGVIYGDGKPIGILQPYEESFKFMPIKEERVYALDPRDSGIDQQEPYINLMYPLTRFSRSDDMARVAQMEAAKAEFLDKHYPSMLVDFKIHNKLHPSSNIVQDESSIEIKRDESTTEDSDNRKKKRYVQKSSTAHNQNEQIQENQTLKKRENKSPVNGTTSQEEPKSNNTLKQQKKSIPKTEQKRGVEVIKSANKADAKIVKRKRESSLTDEQFDKLKTAVYKRHADENAQMIEQDLKSLLSDMGLIEDDLEENANEIEPNRNSVAEDEDLESETNLYKYKVLSNVKQKHNDRQSSERKKRGDINLASSLDKATAEQKLTKNSEAESLSSQKQEQKRSMSNHLNMKEAKRSSIVGASSNTDSSVIPNKREAPTTNTSTEEKKIIKDEKFNKTKSKLIVNPTESYEEYEQRVAREIKMKIKQLKEEVRRELGALDEDNEEEDDEETAAESQRKKRFIPNTLMDEESHEIDPNENVESGELEPHVRRRRMLSIDMSDSQTDSQDSENEFADFEDVDDMNEQPKIVFKQPREKEEKALKNLVNSQITVNDKGYQSHDIKFISKAKLVPTSINRLSYEQARGSNSDQTTSKLGTKNQPKNFVKLPQIHLKKENPSIPMTNLIRDPAYNYHHINGWYPLNMYWPMRYPSRKRNNYYNYGLNNDLQKWYGKPLSRRKKLTRQKIFMPFKRNIQSLAIGEIPGVPIIIEPNPMYHQDLSSSLPDKMIQTRDLEDAKYIQQTAIKNPKNTTTPKTSNYFNKTRQTSIKEKGKDSSKKNDNIIQAETDPLCNTRKSQNLPLNETLNSPDMNMSTKSLGKIRNSNDTNDIGNKNKNEKNKDRARLGNISVHKSIVSNEYIDLDKRNTTNKNNSFNQFFSSSQTNEGIDGNLQVSHRVTNSEGAILKKDIDNLLKNNFEEANERNSNDYNKEYFKNYEENVDISDSQVSTKTSSTPVAHSWSKQIVKNKPFKEEEKIKSFQTDIHLLSKEKYVHNHSRKKNNKLMTNKRIQSESDDNILNEAELAIKKIGKHNLLVPNINISSINWGRRKRNIQEELNHQRKIVRQKRSDLFWPALSYIVENEDRPVKDDLTDSLNAEQRMKDGGEDLLAEDELNNPDQEDINSSKLSKIDKSGVQAQTFSDKNSNTQYDQLSSNTFLPLSRNRRYVSRKFNQPQQQLLSEMSDVDIFGALPQSYDGELARYKRVKRKNDNSLIL